MSYLSLLVWFLAVISLTIARNPTPKYQSLHEEAAIESNGLISYQSPTTDPRQKLVIHNYEGGKNMFNLPEQKSFRPHLATPHKFPPKPFRQGGPPLVNIPGIPGRSPGRPSRPIHD
ncbi:hypothetical protein QL285_035925 [Trifolium repens]|nr:hypothetical protein QL285_035925 [Trifolium repens]